MPLAVELCSLSEHLIDGDLFFNQCLVEVLAYLHFVPFSMHQNTSCDLDAEMLEAGPAKALKSAELQRMSV